MHIKILSGALALSVLAFPAHGEGFALRFGAGYNNNVTIDTKLTEVYSQFYTDIGVNWGLQGDLTANKYDFDTDTRLNFGIHLNYRVTDETWAGAYLGRQDWFGNDFNYYGVEYGFIHPWVAGDMHIGRFEADSGPFQRTLYGIDLDFPLSRQAAEDVAAGSRGLLGQNIVIETGLHGITDGADEQLLYVGAGYKFGNGLKLSATYSKVFNADQDQYGIFFEWNTGEGQVPFSRRGWTAAFKAF